MNALVIRDDFDFSSPWAAFGAAVAFHAMLLGWNPTLFTGGTALQPPALMQVQYLEKAPPIVKPEPAPKPIVHKVEKKIEKRAHKSGLALNKAHLAAAIHSKHISKLAAKPAAQSRRAPVQMPKFVPHASDDESLAMVSAHPQMAQTIALQPATNTPPGPTLHTKSHGVRVSDVHFELADRSGISAAGGPVVNIPIGEERGDTAVVDSAPALHDAPIGRTRVSGIYKGPVGDGVGELAGRNRSGYHGAIQVGEASDEEVIAVANKTNGGSTAGQGFELGGPVGDRKVLRRHLPEYPAWAEEKGISALVKIYFTVKPDGTIRSSMRILRSSGYAELDSLAKEALSSWKFSPTDADSSSHTAWGVITFKFTLA